MNSQEYKDLLHRQISYTEYLVRKEQNEAEPNFEKIRFYNAQVIYLEELMEL